MDKPEKPTGTEIILKPQVPFEDERGKMDYHILTESIDWIGTLITKKGSLRANHYHPEQEQKLLLISGKCVSIFKDLSKEDSEIKHQLVEPGDLVVTAANVAHAVVYLEDCVQINLVKGEREPDNYGKHTITYELVKKEEIEKYMKMYE